MRIEYTIDGLYERFGYTSKTRFLLKNYYINRLQFSMVFGMKCAFSNTNKKSGWSDADHNIHFKKMTR